MGCIIYLFYWMSSISRSKAKSSHQQGGLNRSFRIGGSLA